MNLRHHPVLAQKTKKPSNHKWLLGNNLKQWAGLELNQRHTDFQSATRLVTPLITMTYKRFLWQKRGFQVVDK